MGLSRTLARDIVPGDLIVFLGRPHLVERVEPYASTVGPGWKLASTADGWTIALDPSAWAFLDTMRPAPVPA